MKKTIAIIGVAGFFMLGGVGVANATPPHGGVCTDLDSGKIDVVGDYPTMTVEAPDGFLIDGYCVKAGSVNQGLGPEYFTLTTAVAELTFGHSSGKDISHYSLSFTPASVVPPTPEVVPIAPSIDHLDPCGPDNLVVNVPESTEKVHYTTTPLDGGVKVTATATEGYVLTLDGETTAESFSWEFFESNEPCPVPTTDLPTPPNPPELAETGTDDVWVFALAALGLVLMGFLAWTNDRNNRLR